MSVVYWVLVGAIMFELIAFLCVLGLLRSERLKAEWWESRWIEERRKNCGSGE